MVKNKDKDKDVANFVMPPTIQGDEHDLCHLVLDVKLDTRDGASQRELNRSHLGVETLAQRFPDLRNFVVSLFLGEHKHHSRSSAAERLRQRNQISYTESETLETTLGSFFDSLHALGPGHLRMLVRFTEQREEAAHTEPLLDVHTDVVPPVENTTAESTRQQNGPLADVYTPVVSQVQDTTAESVGQQVLRKAYRNHRQSVSLRI